MIRIVQQHWHIATRCCNSSQLTTKPGEQSQRTDTKTREPPAREKRRNNTYSPHKTTHIQHAPSFEGTLWCLSWRIHVTQPQLRRDWKPVVQPTRSRKRPHRNPQEKEVTKKHKFNNMQIINEKASFVLPATRKQPLSTPLDNSRNGATLYRTQKVREAPPHSVPPHALRGATGVGKVKGGRPALVLSFTSLPLIHRSLAVSKWVCYREHGACHPTFVHGDGQLSTRITPAV
jgi:hypothetical protein